jgi:hypothetical protein
MVERVTEASATFFNDAGEIFDLPHHPWLGISMYLIAAFATGNLLSEAWRAVA